MGAPSSPGLAASILHGMHSTATGSTERRPSADSPAFEADSHGADLNAADPHGQTGRIDDSARQQNFLALAAYQIINRTGWIFKTESIIMPAVLDTVAGAGWVRGWLPLLNRFGYSLPPMLLADRVVATPRKKWILFLTTSLMSACFLLLGVLFTNGTQQRNWWLPLAFLSIYTAFFMCIGVNQITFNTLQGKLVKTTSRGRLLLVASAIGAVTSVTCAFLLMPEWLSEEAPRFDLIFGFAGLMFGLAALTVLGLVEAADRYEKSTSSNRDQLAAAWNVWRRDDNFRRLTFVGALFGLSMMLFPHYQNLGLQGMQLELKSLMWWVMIQNVGTGLFSIPIGRLADSRGNRAVLLIALLGVAAGPILAIALQAVPNWGQRFYYFVFLFVGLTPVVVRTLQNFTLEICPPESHPRYLSVLAISISAPMFLSPVAGLCIDLLGFSAVFLTVAALILLGWVLAFALQEPRELGKVGLTKEPRELP